MRSEQLITMANEIAAFFHGTGDAQQGAENMANHLRRYWDPRMRKQIIQYVRDGGAGLAPIAHMAVECLSTDRV